MLDFAHIVGNATLGLAMVALMLLSIFETRFSRRRTSESNALPKPPPSLRASDHYDDGKKHILLAATGSVATIKIPLIVAALAEHSNISIRLLFTRSAAEFLQFQSAEQCSIASLAALPTVDGIYFDADEWRKPWVRGDNILHIELRRWADLMVIAPLSANSLAKISLGFSDNIITSVVRAWDHSGLIDGARPGVRLPYPSPSSASEVDDLPEKFRSGRKKGIIVAPAMNTAMWSHPVTAKQIAVLEDEWGVGNGGWFEVLKPIEKTLACGDTGSGAMKDWKEIVGIVKNRLGLVSEKGPVSEQEALEASEKP